MSVTYATQLCTYQMNDSPHEPLAWWVIGGSLTLAMWLAGTSLYQYCYLPKQLSIESQKWKMLGSWEAPSWEMWVLYMYFEGNFCNLKEIYCTLFVYENSEGIVEIWLLSWEVNISPSLGESLRVSCYICLAQKYKWKLPEMLVTLYIWSKIQTVEHFCNRRVCNFMKEICHRFDCGVRYCTHFKCTMIDYSVNGVRYSIGKCITVIISQYD